MPGIEEYYEYDGEQLYLRITQEPWGVWRGEIGTSEPVLFEYFQTPREAARYLRGLIREVFPGLSCYALDFCSDPSPKYGRYRK